MSAENLKIYKLKFSEPVHFGEQGVGNEVVLSYILHSDTLYSAILDISMKLFPEDEDILNLVKGKPPFLLSSAFPYVGDTLYYPRPLSKFPLKERLEPSKWKKLKNAKFINERIFDKWIKGEELEDADVNEIIEGWDSLSDLIRTNIRPRVALGHASFASQIYYTARTHFAEGTGLWFMVKFNHDTVKEKFEAALRLLGETGLGGLRSIGHGMFKFDVIEKTLDEVTGQYSILLSVLYPTEIKFLKNSNFALLERRGWALSSTRKLQGFRKIVWMIGEGSILSQQDVGRIVDVTPKDWPDDAHPVYRIGYGFYLEFRPYKGEI